MSAGARPGDPAALLEQWRERCEQALEAALPALDGDPAAQGPPSADGERPLRLHAAMRHAVLGAGKRLRPLLVHAAGACVGAAAQDLDPAAVAVELVHAYSLVHDDLPAMDDDDWRRGRPTVHVAFDEATAVLAGDALQCLAFEVLAGARLPEALRLAQLRTLGAAAGVRGMAGGQALDLAAVGRRIDVTALRRLHALKTGALIRAAVRMGALAGHPGDDLLQRLDGFAAALGLAFQIRDDLLDVEADSATLGKTAGKDAAQDKPTYVSLLGLAGARAALTQQAALMEQALAPLGAEADALRALGRLAVDRSH